MLYSYLLGLTSFTVTAVAAASTKRGLRSSRNLRENNDELLDYFKSANSFMISDEDADSTERFNMKLVNVGDNTEFDSVFAAAAARWEEIIVGDVLDFPAQDDADFDWFGGYFGEEYSYNKAVDDVVIGYAFRPGSYFPRNTILGHASPIYIRSHDTDRWSPPMQAVSGIMEFNTDLIKGEGYTENDLKLIIIHEMGHVLGIGGHYWRHACATECFASLSNNGDYTLDDDAYRCSSAQTEYYNLGLKAAASGAHLLVNHQGSLGNVCGHWAESSFTVNGVSSELMTPFFEEGIAQPLSTVSIGALEDIGYTVNMDAADEFPDAALEETNRRLFQTGHVPIAPDHTFDLAVLMDHSLDDDVRVMLM